MRHFWRLIGFAANRIPIQFIDERHAKDQKDQHSKQNPSSHWYFFEIVAQKNRREIRRRRNAVSLSWICRAGRHRNASIGAGYENRAQPR
jgi:hypothetical protein